MRNNMSPFNTKYIVTQDFGVNYNYYKQFGLAGHEGIDLIPDGADWTVNSIADGTVVTDIDMSSKGGNYGNMVTIWHPHIKNATMYCHLKENVVSAGQVVKAGQRIGTMGSTGNVSGAHLHLNLFNVDINGVRLNKNNGYLGGIDPISLLKQTTGGDSVNTEKEVQFDRMVIYLKSVGVLPTDNSNDYVKNDQLVNTVKRIKSDRDQLAEKATKWDLVCRGVGITGDSSKVTADQVLEKISDKSAQKLKDTLTVLNDAVNKINNINT